MVADHICITKAKNWGKCFGFCWKHLKDIQTTWFYNLFTECSRVKNFEVFFFNIKSLALKKQSKYQAFFTVIDRKNVIYCTSKTLYFMFLSAFVFLGRYSPCLIMSQIILFSIRLSVGICFSVSNFC